MAKAPTDVEDLWRFMDEIPYWTAEIPADVSGLYPPQIPGIRSEVL